MYVTEGNMYRYICQSTLTQIGGAIRNCCIHEIVIILQLQKLNVVDPVVDPTL